MKREIIVAVLVFCIFLAGSNIAKAGTVSWTHDYTFDRVPSDFDPRWKRTGSGRSEIDNDALQISTQGTEIQFWQFSGGGGDSDWDGSRPTTIEFRAAINSAQPDGDGSAIVVSDGRNYFPFFLKSTPEKTFRILLDNGRAELYEEGKSEPISVSKGYKINDSDNANFVYFGDASARVEGESKWKWIRWTNDGLFPF